jgi:hypothetical protein
MPEHIRLIGIFANGAVGIVFGFFTIFMLTEGRAAMALFFALVMATAAFSSYVIRKSAGIIAIQASQQADLQRQIAASQPHPEQQEPTT